MDAVRLAFLAGLRGVGVAGDEAGGQADDLADLLGFWAQVDFLQQLGVFGDFVVHGLHGGRGDGVAVADLLFADALGGGNFGNHRGDGETQFSLVHDALSVVLGGWGGFRFAYLPNNAVVGLAAAVFLALAGVWAGFDFGFEFVKLGAQGVVFGLLGFDFFVQFFQ